MGFFFFFGYVYFVLVFYFQFCYWLLDFYDGWWLVVCFIVLDLGFGDVVYVFDGFGFFESF